MTLVRCSDPERSGAQAGGECSVAANFDPGSPLAAGAEHGEFGGVTFQDEARPGPTLFVGPSRRRDHDRCGHFFRHPARPDTRPEGIAQFRRDRTGFPTGSGATHVLDVDEELDRVHRPIQGAKEPRRPAPHGLDQFVPWGSVSDRAPNLVRVSGQWGPYESGTAVGTPFSDDQVGCEIGGQPSLAQGGCVGTEIDEEVAEGRAFLLSEGG